MAISRGVLGAGLFAVVTAVATLWALRPESSVAPARTSDGARVRTDAPLPVAADAKAMDGTELSGSKPVDPARTPRRRRSLVVVVEGPSGPIASATVTVESNEPFGIGEPSVETPPPPSGHPTPPPEVRSTDAAGRATFVVYGDTSAFVAVAADGYMARSTTHWFDDAGGARLVEEERVRLEPGAKVEGTIVDAASGEPIAAAEVRAGSESEVPDAIADARGAFRFWVDRSTRELHVHVTAAGFVGTHLELALWNGVVIEPRSHTIALRSLNPGSTGSLEVTVVDATGEPFEGAHVWLEAVEEPGAPAWSEDDAGDGATFDLNADRRTNVRGRCVVAGVPLRRAYEVRASALGHAGGRSPVPMRLEAGPTPARADVVLGQVGSLVVKVLDPDGRPASGDVDFWATAEPGPGHGIDAVVSMAALLRREPQRPVEVGTYRFTTIDPGDLVLRATLDGFLGAAGSVEIRPGAESTLTLRLGKGVEIRGTVVDGAGHPLVGAEVEGHRVEAPPRPPEGAFARWRSVEFLSVPSGSSGPLGEFVLRGLATGSYRLEASRRAGPDGEVAYAGSLTLTAPGDVVRIVVHRLGSIRGRFLRPDGAAFQGFAEFRSSSGKPIGSPMPQAAEDGTFEVVDVEDGEHEFVIAVGGFPALRTRISMREGRSIDLGVIRLDEGTTLRGRVVDPSGSPVESATVKVEDESATSREDGSFEIERLARGRHELRVSRDGFLETVVEADLSKDAGPAVVRLARGGVVRGTLRGRGTDGSSDGLSFVRAGTAPEIENSVRATRRSGGRYFVVLLPGAWEAWWAGVGGEYVRLGSVTVEEGAIGDLDLVTSPK